MIRPVALFQRHNMHDNILVESLWWVPLQFVGLLNPFHCSYSLFFSINNNTTTGNILSGIFKSFAHLQLQIHLFQIGHVIIAKTMVNKWREAKVFVILTVLLSVADHTTKGLSAWMRA